MNQSVRTTGATHHREIVATHGGHGHDFADQADVKRRVIRELRCIHQGDRRRANADKPVKGSEDGGVVQTTTT